MATFSAIFSAASFASVAQAAAPGDPGHQPTTVDTHSYHPYQDAHWLYLKQHNCIRSGVTSDTHKGAKTAPYTVACSSSSTNEAFPSGAPSSYSLNYSYVQGVYEPSNGLYPNYGPGTASTDDYGNSYADHDFYDLCGPGAADIALEYWPAPPNAMTNLDVTDPAFYKKFGYNTTTSWTGERFRGYLTYMGWQDNWPSSADGAVGTPWHDEPYPGLMDWSRYPSAGTTLYGMTAALNWEASGRSTSSWENYYYTLAWISQNNNHSDLNADIVWDIGYSHVPVVAEVDPSYLQQNWPSTPHGIHHLITIIGYNNNTGKYEYTDTCGYTTACNTFYENSTLRNTDNTTSYWTTQNDMWAAITAIPEDQRTGSTEGDGGWVW
jgi:hypothetical protein